MAIVASTNLTGAFSVLTRNRWRFRACYSKALAADPNVEGNVVVRADIGEGGDVAASTAVSTTVPVALTECVVNSLSSVRFTECVDAGPGSVTLWIDLARR